eukprot:8129693-Alexandrium_andersonii.AAC.1
MPCPARWGLRFGVAHRSCAAAGPEGPLAGMGLVAPVVFRLLSEAKRRRSGAGGREETEDAGADPDGNDDDAG